MEAAGILEILEALATLELMEAAGTLEILKALETVGTLQPYHRCIKKNAHSTCEASPPSPHAPRTHVPRGLRIKGHYCVAALLQDLGRGWRGGGGHGAGQRTMPLVL